MIFPFSLHMASFNKIIVVTAPSGAGKTSITKHLVKTFPQLAFSISVATRQPRSYETNGVDYYFISAEDFEQKIQRKEFAEWEMVYEGKYYGTLKSELQRIWNNNQIPLLDIDVKGAIHMQRQYPESLLTLFIEPPSIDELKRRLESRGTESAESLEARINKASYELSFKNHFDKSIVNDFFERACKEAEDIVREFLKSNP
ncbi:MAG TPA: guanylate kinase [Chitinophagaceae bacterium]|nr:guanylate kinase [Chitinophagaceae bacterium]